MLEQIVLNSKCVALNFAGRRNCVTYLNLICNKGQGSKGIRQNPINWYTSPKQKHKITPFVEVKIFHLTLISKFPKLLSQQIRKHLYKTLGTSVINSPISPLSLILWLITWTLLWCILSPLLRKTNLLFPGNRSIYL